MKFFPPRLEALICWFLGPPAVAAMAPKVDDQEATRKTQQHQLQSPIFQLPGEIRDVIYGYYLEFCWDDVQSPRDDSPPLSRFFGENPAGPIPALMAACKRLYREMSPRASREAALVFSCLGFHPFVGQWTANGFASHGPLRLDRLLSVALSINSNDTVWWITRAFQQYLVSQMHHVKEIRLDLYGVPSRPGQRRAWLVRQQRGLAVFLGELRSLEKIRLRGTFPVELVAVLQTATKAEVVTSKLTTSWGLPWVWGDSGIVSLNTSA